MTELGPASENDMILTFLRGEIDSQRFGHLYRGYLKQAGFPQSTIIDHADLTSERDNMIRRELLKAVRGYGANTYLFAGFPEDVTWRRVTLTLEDFTNLQYANFETWLILTNGSRRVLDGATNIDAVPAPENANEHIKAVAEKIKEGRRYPELIGVQGNNAKIILVEGHTRATAYVIAHLAERIGCFIGSSPAMKRWAFY